ncbi:dual OB domain-containing protein [Embleya scabrispora]|uniref:dual OB domain-containing protein n=1 Tax=Embleya scabrispora TaxID=159449 RepID=UPI000C7D8424|nr:hypothetical protein [Embleya scabrispora]
MERTNKTLVCLANSRKHSARCVAGIVDDGSGEWIRPVGDRPKREVSERERRYRDGTEPNVLDVVAVSLLRPQPYRFQTENWLLDPDCRWRRTGRIGWSELLTLEQRPDTLWINGSRTFHGANDCVPTEKTVALRDSLKLIRVTDLTLRVNTPRARFGDPSKALSACFSHAGHAYILRVTDPTYEQEYLIRSEGTHELGESFLTISLGEPFEGHAYKLVAAIIERARIQV